MYKKGLSNIIGITLIVLLTVSGVSILWLGLSSFLDVDFRTFDTRMSIVTSTGYTFYDPTPGNERVTVQVEAFGKDAPNYVQLILTLEDGSELLSVHDAPLTNARIILYLDASSISIPKKASIAPIFVVDGKAVLGNRITPITLPTRNEQTSYYSSFGQAKDPQGIYPTKGPLASGGGGGGSGGGSSGSLSLCDFASYCITDCFGEEESPGVYKICTCEDLQLIGESTSGTINDGNNLNDNYILMNDIDCSATKDGSSIWDSGGFEPIGGITEEFIGTFDGNNKEISNLYIYKDSTPFVGLFGAVSNGIIEDVSLVDVDILGDQRVGALAGNIEVSSISNVMASGSVVGVTHVGGLVGFGSSTSEVNIVSDCLFDGSVEGQSYVGGLIGYASLTTITNCEVTNLVTASDDFVGGLVGSLEFYGEVKHSSSIADVDSPTGDFVGGLIGYVDEHSSVLESFATGSVSGHGYVGGIIGRYYGTKSAAGRIENTYSSSDVVGTQNNIGGLIGEYSYNQAGFDPDRFAFSNSYFWGTVNGQYNLGGATVNAINFPGYSGVFYDRNVVTCNGMYLCEDQGFTDRTTAQLQSQTYLESQGWNFVDVWEMGASGYPQLK